MEKMIKRSSMFVAAAGIATLLSFIIMAAQSGGPLKPADHPNERGFNSASVRGFGSSGMGRVSERLRPF